MFMIYTTLGLGAKLRKLRIRQLGQNKIKDSNMTSQEQSEANRRNALKSTGPKSKKGKARASLNALKHGLRAKDIVLPSEDGREFDGLRRALITELGPEGSLEEQIAERIVACLWRLRRVYPIEAGIFVWESLTIELRNAEEEARGYQSTIRPRWAGDSDAERMTNQKKHNKAMTCASKATQLLRRQARSPGAAFRQDARIFNALSKLSRYETAIERSLFRALHLFEQLQAARREREASTPEVGDAPDNLRRVQQLSNPHNGG